LAVLVHVLALQNELLFGPKLAYKVSLKNNSMKISHVHFDMINWEIVERKINKMINNYIKERIF
jgi:hypothetical protein